LAVYEYCGPRHGIEGRFVDKGIPFESYAEREREGNCKRKSE
jgi:hypothetical protein